MRSYTLTGKRSTNQLARDICRKQQRRSLLGLFFNEGACVNAPISHIRTVQFKQHNGVVQ
jgi:hypothetical protein